MKRIISILLCVLMFAMTLVTGVSAISVNSGNSKLSQQFIDGVCTNGIDYVYYSPIKKNDTTKYPLLVWVHGMKSGSEPRAQIKYGIQRWASDEYQAKFEQGGCFVFIPRSANSAINNWDATQTGNLKGAIDEFVAKHKDNIDMSRIYIAGYSTGGVMVWDMLGAYPDYFAAAIPASAISQPSSATIAKLKDVSIWIFSCDKDFYAGGTTTNAMTTFDALNTQTARPEGVRITWMSEAVLANGNKKSETVDGVTRPTFDAEHYTWEAITHDMHMTNGDVYHYSQTKDGTGKAIDFSDGSGLIDWLTKQARPEEKSKTSIFDTFRLFFEKIIAFFKNLFK